MCQPDNKLIVLAPVDAKLKRRAADGGQKGAASSAPKRPRPAPTLPPSSPADAADGEARARRPFPHLLRSVRFLLDARRACEYSITTYLSSSRCSTCATRASSGRRGGDARGAHAALAAALLDELAAQAAPERQPALVAAALALHGAEPLTAELLGPLAASSPTSTSKWHEE